MNKTQTNDVNMLLRVIKIFSDYAKIFKAYKPLKVFIESFEQKEANLDADIKQQALAELNNSQKKDAKKAKAAKTILPLAQTAKAWAKATGKTELEQLFDVNKNSFTGDEIAVATLEENIAKAIKDNLANMNDYEITDADANEALAAVADFKAAIGTPQVSTGNLKVLNEKIAAEIKEMKNLLAEDIDPLMEARFSVKNAKEYGEYVEARKIGLVGFMHTTISCHVYTDASKAHTITNATVSIKSLNRSTKTNADGYAEIVQFTAGTYMLTIAATGYADKEIEFTVKNGKKVDVEVVMG